jgi:acetyl/propionyl-CoA carboxylase alpha subunit
VAKLVAWGEDRGVAIARMSRALREYQILGINTTIPFFQWLMARPEYREGRYDTTYLDRLLADMPAGGFTPPDAGRDDLVAIAAALDAYLEATRSGDAVSRGPRSLWVEAARREAVGE